MFYRMEKINLPYSSKLQFFQFTQTIQVKCFLVKIHTKYLQLLKYKYLY